MVSAYIYLPTLDLRSNYEKISVVQIRTASLGIYNMLQDAKKKPNEAIWEDGDSLHCKQPATRYYLPKIAAMIMRRNLFPAMNKR